MVCCISHSRLLNKTSDFDKKTRWFLLHSIGNVFTVYVIWDELIIGLTNPIWLYQLPTKHRGFMVVFSLHLYHMIRFKLTYQDWIHHVVFVFLGLTYSVIYQPYIVTSLPFLSLNGIPGTVDYFLISLVREGLFERQRQKNINAFINCWFRCPYGIFISGCGYVSMLTNDRWAGIPCIIFVIINSIYYCNQAVKNAVQTKHIKV